jgi:hypothetical protein
VQAALNELDAEKLQHAQYTTAGTSAAYTLTPTPAITAYAAGQSFFASFALASGASPTMAISGIATPPNLVKQLADGTYANIAAGDIAINHRSRVTLISTTQALVERIRPMDTPAGTIIDFSGVSAPNGFLVCPTSLTNISRTTYAALFLAIGTTWGAGDGSTTFGLPWFAANYAAVQASGNVGTSSVGQVLSHSHTQNNYNLLSTRAGGGDGNFWDGVVGAQTASTGGSANLAAGVRVLKCVKF